MERDFVDALTRFLNEHRSMFSGPGWPNYTLKVEYVKTHANTLGIVSIDLTSHIAGEE